MLRCSVGRRRVTAKIFVGGALLAVMHVQVSVVLVQKPAGHHLPFTDQPPHRDGAHSASLHAA